MLSSRTLMSSAWACLTMFSQRASSGRMNAPTLLYSSGSSRARVSP